MHLCKRYRDFLKYTITKPDVSKRSSIFQKTQINFQKHNLIFKNTIQFHDNHIHSTFTDNTIQFSKTQIHMKTFPDIHDSLSRGSTVFSPVARSHHRDYSQRREVLFKMWHDPWRLQFLNKMWSCTAASKHRPENTHSHCHNTPNSPRLQAKVKENTSFCQIFKQVNPPS